MRTELLGQEKNIVRIRLDIEANEFTKALNKAINELSQQVNIPGFRKGKISRSVLELRFGRDALYNEAMDKIMNEELNHIVDDYELEVIETPSVNITDKIEEGKPVSCEITFEVRPEVELPDIENLEIEKVVSEVTEEAVDSLAKRIRIQLADIKPVERAIQDGDLVDIELVIKTLNPDGSETEDQPKPEATHEKINLADETIRAQVREALIGKSAGDVAAAVFDVEAGHSERTLAGKHVGYTMRIENVSEYVLPEVNEKFYQDVFGPDTDIKDNDAFRARLRADITNQVAEESRVDLHNRAVDMVAGLSKLDIPEKLLARQEHSMRHDDEEWAKQNAVDLNEAYGLNTEEGKKGYEKLLHDRAVTTVRNVLVMDELAKKYDIHLEQKDIEAEFERRAAQLNVSKAFVAKFFYENREQLDRMTDELRWDKIADALISHMKVKEVKELSQPQTQAQEANN